MKTKFTVFVAALFSGTFAWADCASPAGVAGQMNYAAPNFQVCDGNVWSMMDAGGPGSPCSNPGRISLNGSSQPRFCSPSGFVSLNGSETGSSCAGTEAGTFNYDVTNKYMRWCDGSNWRPMRAASTGIAYVKSASVNVAITNPTTATTSTFSTLGATNLLACIVIYNSMSNVVSTVVATGGQSLVRAGSARPEVGGYAAGYRAEVWYKENLTAQTNATVTATLSGPAATTIILICDEYSGVATSNALDQVVSAGLITTNPFSVGPVTTTTAKELLFSVGTSDAGVPTAGSGFTQPGPDVNDTITQYRVVNTPGSYTATMNRGPGGSYGALFLVTFRGR